MAKRDMRNQGTLKKEVSELFASISICSRFEIFPNGYPAEAQALCENETPVSDPVGSPIVLGTERKTPE
jgi:hypothetical protein